MASLASSTEMEVSTSSETLGPPPDEEACDPKMIISLIEIGPRPCIFWGSLFSKNNSSHKVTGLTAQKFRYVLKEIESILKNVTSFEEKTTEAEESFKNTNISEDVSEFKENITGLGNINKMLLKNLFVSLDPKETQNAKTQEKILDNQNSKNKVRVFARDSVNHSEEERTPNETQLSKEEKEKEKDRLLQAQEENVRLRKNMERLLQEAEHWSEQQTELSELIKLYHKSQNDLRVQIQWNNQISSKHKLEEQLRKLKCDTYSLNLIAALLENECQILQQRVEILSELYQQNERALQKYPTQINYEEGKGEQKSSEEQKLETYQQRMQETEGTFPNRSKFSRSLDSCYNKKARNNRFNIRLSTAALLGKKRSIQRK
ncbi:spermatogenic leucine zipper protein 1 [Dasypus novemcinctus]|uniref:spermatogenic leucine zipper protein 1 n=1 Tax=Dasypus novemcinctus TaxID=9361 RepID=UPI0003292415|nr:spermatogenic leucine zipper protein 1 [Dasypus novemcinctus]